MFSWTVNAVAVRASSGSHSARRSCPYDRAGRPRRAGPVGAPRRRRADVRPGEPANPDRRGQAEQGDGGHDDDREDRPVAIVAADAHRLGEPGPDAVLGGEHRVVGQPEAGHGEQTEAKGRQDPGRARGGLERHRPIIGPPGSGYQG